MVSLWSSTKIGRLLLVMVAFHRKKRNPFVVNFVFSNTGPFRLKSHEMTPVFCCWCMSIFGGYVAKPWCFCCQKVAKPWLKLILLVSGHRRHAVFFLMAAATPVSRDPISQSDIIRPWGSFSEAGFHGMLWNVGCRMLTPLILSSNVLQCSPVGSWCPRASHWCKLVNLTIDPSYGSYVHNRWQAVGMYPWEAIHSQNGQGIPIRCPGPDQKLSRRVIKN